MSEGGIARIILSHITPALLPLTLDGSNHEFFEDHKIILKFIFND